MARPPTKADLLLRIQELEERTLPHRSETFQDSRNEPASTLTTLTADRVFQAITAAEQGDTRELFAIYRDVLISDTHIQSCIETRFLAVIGDDPMITAANKDKPEDVAAADFIRAAVDRMPDFLGLCQDLLWGNIWPLSMVERMYTDAPPGSGYAHDWGDIGPVPDYLFRWTEGHLELEQLDPKTRQPNGKFERPDPRRFIVHKGHFLRTPDNWGGPMRAIMWWFLLKVMDREWWVRFLDRFGTPFPVAHFEKNDDRSRQILERAFKLSSRIGGIVVSKGTQVELIQASTSTANAHEAFFNKCNDEISRRVLGQTLSSTASPTGLGNGASDLQGQVRGDIASFDKRKLAQTVRQQHFKPLLRINGLTGAVPLLAFGGEEPEENTTTAEVLSKLSTAGLRLADKSLPVLSQRIGLEIERDPAPTTPPAAGTRSLAAPRPGQPDPAGAAGSISREAAATLSQIYRGTLAPIRQIVLDSATPAEAQAKLLAAFVDWDATKAAEVVETAITAGAWNGFDS